MPLVALLSHTYTHTNTQSLVVTSVFNSKPGYRYFLSLFALFLIVLCRKSDLITVTSGPPSSLACLSFIRMAKMKFTISSTLTLMLFQLLFTTLFLLLFFGTSSVCAQSVSSVPSPSSSTANTDSSTSSPLFDEESLENEVCSLLST